MKEILDNRQTILNAADNIKWKIDLARTFVQTNGKKYDIRNCQDLAALLIDVNGVPKENREAYFLQEIEKIAMAFNTPGPIPGKPDPKAIKPYIDQMFKRITTTNEIDWSNQQQVEDFFATARITQALATMVDDFFPVSFSMFPTHDELSKLDAHTARAFVSYLHNAPKLSRAGLGFDIDKRIKLGIYGADTPFFDSQSHVCGKICDAVEKNESVIIIDATADDSMKKYCLKEDFQGHQVGIDTFTQEEYSVYFLDSLSGYNSNTSLEQVIFRAVKGQLPPDTFISYDLLMINGKSVNDMLKEAEKKTGAVRNIEMERKVAKKVRDALTDGKSVVSIMTINYDKDGKVKFNHKDLKLDLDKLNAADRNETNYSFIRRLLDKLGGIFKIQKYASNQDRDAKQAKVKESTSYKNAIRAAEDRFINYYNGIDRSDVGPESILSVIPKIERLEPTAEKQISEQTSERIADKSDLRVKLPPIDLEAGEKHIPSDPPKEIEEKVNKRDFLTK